MGYKRGLYTHKKSRKRHFLPTCFGFTRRTSHALGACVCIPSPNSPFFRCFRCFLPNNLPRDSGTKFLPLQSLVRPLESSFFIFPKSSQIFGYSRFADLHDFFLNYFKKKPIKLLCFGKTRIVHSKSRTHRKLL